MTTNIWTINEINCCYEIIVVDNRLKDKDMLLQNT